jgi:hypothetical protein
MSLPPIRLGLSIVATGSLEMRRAQVHFARLIGYDVVYLIQTPQSAAIVDEATEEAQHLGTSVAMRHTSCSN